MGLGSDFAGNPDIVFVMPKEGGMIWQDNLAILADFAEQVHRACVHQLPAGRRGSREKHRVCGLSDAERRR